MADPAHPKTTDGGAAARADARTAIENLLYLYTERIDAGDFAGVGEMFAKGRMVGPDGTEQGAGRDAVKAIYDQATKLYEDGTPRTQHLTSNVHIEFEEGDQAARVRSRFTVFQALPAFPLQPIITGHYADRFACSEDEGWHFTERRMRPTLLGDLSRHLKYSLGDS